MVVYYAHCMAIYDTPQERRDVALLEALGFTVLNPNAIDIQARCAAAAAAGADVMRTVFEPIVNSCHAFAFRALPDGAIPAGVAKEIEYARAAGLPVFELPSGIGRRVITLEQTREYLAEVGER